MSRVIDMPPMSTTLEVTETLHGIPITDPYRWLESQNSAETREWLGAQARYARSYLDGISGREQVFQRVRELVDTEIVDSLLVLRGAVIFRKRQAGQEQPSIWIRNATTGDDELLVDPSEFGTGPYTSVRPIRISGDGRLLAYEIKQGGERPACCAILDIADRRTLPDALERGYLRGLVFAPDSKSFFYVHEDPGISRKGHRAVRQHAFGTSSNSDEEIFVVPPGDKLRLGLVSGGKTLGILVHRLRNKVRNDFYLWNLDEARLNGPVIAGSESKFGPKLLDNGRILAITDRDAPNFRIVELICNESGGASFVDIVPVAPFRIQGWMVAANYIFVSYCRESHSQIDIFDLTGKYLRRVPAPTDKTLRLLATASDQDFLFFEQESFTEPASIYLYSAKEDAVTPWARRDIPLDQTRFRQERVSFTAKDGTRIPMFLVGSAKAYRGLRPTLMTAYGGFGISMTPQFSVLAAIVLEKDWLLAVPNIRGGSEFGVEWHHAARRRNRQVAFDDFISAAEWLIGEGYTIPQKLGIFGGSNSGLLVATAMVQRADLFRAVLCLNPLLDMLRYHRFDNAEIWKEEYGTADDSEDFRALAKYSPYHTVRDGVFYPATMIVSGDVDQNCNGLHARKMTARLQNANAGDHPIILDYHPLRGHSAVLPLSQRLASLTDRLTFLIQELEQAD